MKKSLLFSAFVLTAFSATFVSCKKEDNQKSRQELIVGTWNIAASGLDSNKNNILDPSESDTPDSLEIGRLLFNANGSGISEYGTIGNSLEQERFNWTLSPDGKTLRIEQVFTFNHVVTELTQNRLAYYFEENGNHYFEIFTR